MNNWKTVKLGDVCEIILGQSPPSSTYNTKGKGLPFFQGKSEFAALHPIPSKWCSNPQKIALRNDILISVRAPVGATNIADQECCIGRGLAAIRYPDCNKYIYYFLRRNENQLDNLGTGTTFKAISGKVLTEFLLPFPPLPIQQKIVEKIEELFSELDNGIENLRKVKEQIKTYRQSVLAYAFAGKLTENVKGLSVGILAGETENGKLPEGWKWVKLGEICVVTSSKRIYKKEYVFEGIPFFRTKEIVELSEGKNISIELYISKDLYNKIKSNFGVPKRNDILISAVGTIGVTYLVNKNDPFYFKDGNLLWLKDIKEMDVSFLKYALPKFVKSNIDVSGSAYNALTIIKLKNLMIPNPPLLEQNKIVSEIERRFSVADKLEQTIDESLEKAEQMRQSILKKAFEGKLIQ